MIFHIIAISIIAFITLFADHANACSCRSMPSVEASLSSDHVQHLFRGFVQREIVMNNTNDFSPKYYLVTARRVYKGCAFKNGTNVIVKTSSNSAMCGISIPVKKPFIFSASGTAPEQPVINATIRSNPHVYKKQILSVGSCDLNVATQFLPIEQKTLLSQTINLCTTCTSAADCPGGIDGGEYYCDKSLCVAYDKPCPPILDDDFPRPKPSCLEDPCLRNTTATCNNAKCITNKCNMCAEPLWIDSIGNRVTC